MRNLNYRDRRFNLTAQQQDKTSPFAISFECGHYAVWQCRDEKHAMERAKETYPKKVVKTIKAVT